MLLADLVCKGTCNASRVCHRWEKDLPSPGLIQPCPISGLHLFLQKAAQTKCSERVRPRLWDLCSWGSMFQAPQPPTLFSLVSPGSQMGAQNTSTQPSLRLSPCCLLLPGCRDPGAELCAEPLVRSSPCCYISMQKMPLQSEGEKGHLLSSVKSNPSVLLFHGWITSASGRFIPGFVIKVRDAAAWQTHQFHWLLSVTGYLALLPGDVSSLL